MVSLDVYFQDGLGLGILRDAVWSMVETSPNDVSQVFSRQHVSRLSPWPDTRNTYDVAELIGQSRQLYSPYPEVRPSLDDPFRNLRINSLV
jgi:hypothetical protein